MCNCASQTPTTLMRINTVKSICVFAGSNSGSSNLYKNAAISLGEAIVRQKINLVYGGGQYGLMGILADTVLKNGGTVLGVITHLLNKTGEGHNQLTKMYKVETMQERKTLMAQLADGFLVLPGGLGTLDEFFDIWEAKKLQIHDKPIGVLNINNFYTKLLDFISQLVSEDFLKKMNQALITISDDPDALLVNLKNENSEPHNKQKFSFVSL